MNKLLTSISVLALMAGTAYATEPSNTAAMVQAAIDQSFNTNKTITQAWEDRANPLPDMEPVDPREADVRKPDDVVKPEPDEATVRMMKDRGDSQSSYIDQVGDGNMVDVEQTDSGAGTVSDIVIVGDDNMADVDQSQRRNGNAGDYATITIQGDENSARIEQINQSGAGSNKADIHIGGQRDSGPDIALGADPKARSNTADITQRGSANLAEIDIAEDDVSFGPEGNEADIFQQGVRNSAKIDQTDRADFNEASIEQRGVGEGGRNTAEIDQDFNYNDSKIVQIGTRNRALSEQIGVSLSEGDVGNDQFTYQDGADNNAYTLQDGRNNLSVTWQLGNNNVAKTTQEGDLNDSSILQDGDFNSAEVFQTSNSNLSGIEMIGDRNAAYVSQTGGDISDIQMHGSLNTAVVTQ